MGSRTDSKFPHTSLELATSNIDPNFTSSLKLTNHNKLRLYNHNNFHLDSLGFKCFPLCILTRLISFFDSNWQYYTVVSKRLKNRKIH